MTEKTIIATEKIAEYLKMIMKDKGITTYQLRQKGIHANKIHSVLRLGNHKNANYTIEAFVEVLSGIGIHLEFHDLGQKSNFDLDKKSQN